ncbi:MAG: hypothetical protein PWP23_1224 [Candidatus Sumerlaeota bacterium]|nr:hypothetical protein [Candidatus Sumerlaeota bacterium]
MRTRWVYRLPVDGAVFIFVTLLIGLAAMNTGAQLLYLVFGMMCALWILSDFMATSSMSRLRFSRHLPAHAVAREPVEIAVTIENRKRTLSSFSLRVQDSDSEGRLVGATFFTRVPPRGSARETYQCVFPRRGTYRLSRLTIATRFPFGLIERRIHRKEESEILVLPPTIPLGSLAATIRAEFGNTETRVKGHGSGLYGIREYTEGESARDIHWKLSARASSLMIREFESDRRRNATIILDNRFPASANKTDRDNLERGIVLAASLVLWLLGRGYEVELATASGRVPFGAGASHRTRLLRALALLEPLLETGCDPMLSLQDPHSLRLAVLYRDAAAPAGTIPIATSRWSKLLDEVIEHPLDDAPATGTLTLDALPASSGAGRGEARRP